MKKKNKKEEKNEWDEEWKNFKGLNWFGKRFSSSERKLLKKILPLILKKNAKILDLGCGYCETTLNLMSTGFENIIGIDNSLNGLRWCKKRGFKKNIFLMNGTKTGFKDDSFDLVFERGVLEHFEDFTPFVKEMCRVSRKYILISQPNHFSLWKKLIHFFRGLPVGEYTYTPTDFIKSFEKYGFELIEQLNYHFNEHFMMLFKRKMSK